MVEVKVEPEAVQMIMDFEESDKCATVPYQDPVGIWTIGYGSIWDWRTVPKSRVTQHTPPVDEATARIWIANELSGAVQEIRDVVKVELTDGELTALEDFIYNLGAGNFVSSTLLKKLNARDYAGAAREIDKWDMAGGKVMAGLLRRRQAETNEFLE